jgi:nucleoside-diphosphate-sugar epimerase
MENAPIAVVTGASGFVGSHLVDNLLAHNFRVRCILRSTSSRRWLEGKDVEIFDCGLFDRDGLSKAFKDAQYIFHVAGVVKAKKPEGYYRGNVEATEHILEAALMQKESIKKIVIVGSQTAAGPSKPGEPKTEDMTPEPITTYGRSKLEQEQLAAKYMDRLPITICRAPAVYGERDTEIMIFFQTYKKGLMTKIGFNHKELNLIHAADLVEGLRLAALSDNAKGEIYFITSKEFYTWDRIGNICADVLGKKAFSVRLPHAIVYSVAGIAQFFSMFSKKAATLNIEKARDITRQYWTCSHLKAKDQIGFEQQISIEEGIKRTFNWYFEKGWIKR